MAFAMSLTQIEYHSNQINIQDNQGESYTTKANHSMWRCAMAWQFMALFNKKILTANVAPILKEWARILRVCANWNHNKHNSHLIDLQIDSIKIILGKTKGMNFSEQEQQKSREWNKRRTRDT
ncbi:hypothetical protein VP01_3470g2 [Puccinia sorghi]|uniref:Uncharacterized protein n=1 Tax=Puccinia sorghi TaxID=27349 RepID=A0A0L6UVY7_9BASI|nr:hypothetical protein VP01_3470g2 [Puccinia sorghi]